MDGARAAELGWGPVVLRIPSWRQRAPAKRHGRQDRVRHGSRACGVRMFIWNNAREDADFGMHSLKGE